MMAVRDFELYLSNTREMFRDELESSDMNWKIDLREFILRSFRLCSNQFEEDTLRENLQEEFGLYLESLKKAE